MIKLGRAKEYWMEMQQEHSDDYIASILGISIEELECLDWEIFEDRSKDGLLYNYRIEFDNVDNNKKILEKIKDLENGHSVYLDPWVFEDEIDDQELEWEVESSDQLKVFKNHLASVEALLDINITSNPQTEFSLLVMLHAHIIASIERYISSIFIHKVTNSDELTRKLIETDPYFGSRKFTLNKIYLQHEKLKMIVASYLKSLIFHNLKKVKPMYKAVLGFDFGDISWLFKAITIRHDCAHRAGYNKEGEKINISTESIKELIGKSRELVNKIESHIE